MKPLLLVAISVLLFLGSHARGRSAAEVVKQGDRIGWSADGSLVDPDDLVDPDGWGATAIALAIFAKQSWQDKLVHLDCSNRLDKNNPVKAAEEAASVVEGVKNFKFTTTKLDDCQTELEAAIANATAESSKDSRFWYVQAGPFEVAYQPLKQADPEKRPFCILVSHSGVNERSGKWKDAHGKDECVKLGGNLLLHRKAGQRKVWQWQFSQMASFRLDEESPLPRIPLGSYAAAENGGTQKRSPRCLRWWHGVCVGKVLSLFFIDEVAKYRQERIYPS